MKLINTKGFQIIKKIISVIIFFVILVYLVSKTGQFARPDDSDTDMWATYYAEDKNTIDVIMIGSSALYRYWIAPQAYEEQGFTSTVIGSASQDICQIPYIMEEAVKSQDADLIVVELRNIVARDQYDAISPEEQKYRFEVVTSGMNPSITRLKMINDLYDEDLISKMEMMFSVLKYHNNLMEYDRDYLIERLKNEPVSDKYVNVRADVKAKKKLVYESDDDTILSEKSKTYIDAIEDKAKELDKKVLLIFTPYKPRKDQIVEQKQIGEYCKKQGYDYLDMNLYVDDIGLDFSTDLYNGKHTNVAGSQKVTTYLAEYMKQQYGLSADLDKKQKAEWQHACELWHEERTTLMQKWEDNIVKEK